MAEDPLRASLLEMGFDAQEVDAALAATNNTSVEAAMQHIVERQEAQMTGQTSESDPAKETEEPKRPLTDEERRQKAQELEELRLKKRAEREESEKKAEEERERRRIREGKTLSQIKREMEDKEIKKAAEERRREKREYQLAKERVRAQIEADKLARKQAQDSKTATTPNMAPAAMAAPPSNSTATKDYDSARLQLRLPDGSALVHTFSAKETLAAVRLYVRMNRSDGKTEELPQLMTSFPKKVFDESDYESPLDALGLVPSAVLIIKE